MVQSRTTDCICPLCRTRLRFAESSPGMTLNCPECGTALVVSADNRVSRAADSIAPSKLGFITWSRVTFTNRGSRRFLIVLSGIALACCVIVFRPRSSLVPIQSDDRIEVQDPGSQAASPRPNLELPANTPQAVAQTEELPNPVEPVAVETKKDLVSVVERPVVVEKEVPLPMPKPVEAAPGIPKEELEPALALPKKPPPVPLDELLKQRLQSFEITQPTSLRFVLRDLNELIDLRMEIADSITAEQLQQRVTMKIKDALLLDVLHELLKPTKLQAIRRDEKVWIEPRK